MNARAESLAPNRQWLSVEFCIGAALAVATFVAFAPALRAGFIWDDHFLTENNAVRTLGGLWQIWTDPSVHVSGEHYWPMLWTSFWIEYQFWEFWAPGYHFTNIALHVINALLVWRLLLRLEVPGPWIGAALFGLHPVHVESVAWVIERKDVLSGLFYLLSATVFLGADERNPWRSYAVSLVLFLCAMLTKSVAITLPVALALVVWWKRGAIARREWIALAVMLGVGAVVEAISMSMISEIQKVRDQSHPALALGALDRVIVAGRAIWFYSVKIIAPIPLMSIYPQWEIDARDLAQWIYPVGVVALLALLWRARGNPNIGRGPFVAAAFFVVTHSPTLGFINFGHMQYSYVADRFQYLPSIAPLALIASGIILLLRHRLARMTKVNAKPSPVPLIAYSATALILLLCGLITWRQSTLYRDRETLWLANLELNPKAPLLHYDLGLIRQEAGRLDEAEKFYRRAIELEPRHTGAHANLSVVLMRKGRLEDARELARKAIELSPDFAIAHTNYGAISEKLGDIDEAIAAHKRAIELVPDAAEYRFNLGIALRKRRDWAAAADAFKKSADLNPDLFDAYSYWGEALLQLGRPAEAARVFRDQVARNIGSAAAHSNLATALIQAGQVAEGAEELRRALKLEPRMTLAAEMLKQIERGAPNANGN